MATIDIAMESTSQEILEKVDALKENSTVYGFDYNLTNKVHEHQSSISKSGISDSAKHYIKIYDYQAEKDGLVTMKVTFTAKYTKERGMTIYFGENSEAFLGVASGTDMTGSPSDGSAVSSKTVSIGTTSTTYSVNKLVNVKRGYFYTMAFAITAAFSKAATLSFSDIKLEVYALEV